MVNIDPGLINFLVLGFIALSMGIILKIFKQPPIIAYIFTGVILGPFVLGFFNDSSLLNQFGNFGVILLLFFAGMETSLPRLFGSWRISILGTIVQVLFSVLVMSILGYFFDWSFGRVLLLGFVISLSSTAVVMSLLQDKEKLKMGIGQDILGILLIQDVIVIPMIIVLSLFSGETVSNSDIALQVIGGSIAILFLFYLVKKESVHLPFGKQIKSDKELQVFAAFIVCFGLSVIAGLFELSTALGAFLAGVFLSTAKETEWVHHSLYSFKVLFLALFFVSIGMLIDLDFLREYFLEAILILFFVYLINTFINALIFRLNGRNWRQSFYEGAFLSQIGEFSFILAAIGIQIGLINEFAYDMTIVVIALSLIISPFWIGLFSKFLKKEDKS